MTEQTKHIEERNGDAQPLAIKEEFEVVDRVPETKNLGQLVFLYSKTGALILSWICLGLYSEVLGPSLPELQRRVCSNYEEISRALSARACGYFLGSIIGGMLNDRFVPLRCYFLCGALLLAGTTVSLVPMCFMLWQLAFVLFLGGLAHGLHTTGGNPSLGELWQEKASGPFNLMHAGYGLGGAIAPVLIQTFHITSNNTTVNTTTLRCTPSAVVNASINITNTSPVPLEYPYAIVTTICFITAALFLVFGIYASKTSTTSFNRRTTSSFTLKQILKSNLHLSNLLFSGIIFIVYFVLVGNERVFGKFLYTYARDSRLQISPKRAYLINTIYWVSFCLARMFAFVVSFWVPAQLLYLVQLVGTVSAASVLAFIPASQILFFIFSAIYGAFKSPLFPTGLAVINRYTEVSGFVTLVVNVGASVGAILCQYMTGSLMQKYGPDSFLYIIVSTAAILLGIGSVLLFVGRLRGDRFKSKPPPLVTDEKEAHS